jgi:ribosomal protein S18 acetylase RimI-like enzyme
VSTHPPTGPIDVDAIPETCIVRRDPRGWILVNPIPPGPFSDLVRVYAPSRRHSLHKIIGDPFERAEVLGTRYRPERICVAVKDGELAGLLSYRMDGKGSVWPDWHVFRRRFGLVSGTVRFLLTEASLRRNGPDDLLIESYVVLPAARGQGIGRALLDWLSAEVVSKGKKGWRTEMPAQNENARIMYERYGARAAKVINLGPIGHLFHATRVTLYRWEPPGDA